MFTTPQVMEIQTANTTGTASHSKTVTLSNGNILVAYITELGGVPGTDDGFRIRGQVFDTDGNKVGGEVNFGFTASIDTKDFDIVALADNRAAIVASSGFKDVPFARLFDLDNVDDTGSVFSSAFEDARVGGSLNNYGATITSHSDIEAGFVTHAVAVGFAGRDIVQTVNIRNPESIQKIGGDDDGRLDSAQLKNGSIALLIDEDGDSTDKGQLRLNLYREDGSLIRQDARIGKASSANFEASVTALANGNFVVAFTEDDGDKDIRFQIFNQTGSSVTGLKQTGIGSAGRTNHNESAVAALADGGFIIFYDKDDGVPGIRGQRFDAAGNPLGADFLVTGDNGAQLSATTLPDGRVAVSYTLASQGEIETAILTFEPIVKTGTAGNDVIRGTLADDINSGLDGNDVMEGRAGNDTLFGGNGGDLLIGDSGNDMLDGGDGGDELQGNAGNDSLFGGAEGDQLFGGSGNDSLDGGAGDDTLDGGEGNDVLVGGTGNDTLDGGAGNDLLVGNDGNDSMFGSLGNDSLDGGTGNDRLDGSLGNDSLNGGSGNDTLDGGAGNDVLIGDGGNDRLIATQGSDILTGGAGADVFVFAFETVRGGGSNRQHVVTDFEIARSGEKIDLSAIEGIDSFADLKANHLIGEVSSGGSHTLIRGGDLDQTTILLQDIAVGQLTAGDFIF